MGIAIFPHGGQTFDIPAPTPHSLPSVTYPQPNRSRATMSPRERFAAEHMPGRVMRRLTTLGVYVTGVLISASVGPLIYAIGDRESAARWAFDVLDLLGKF
jgi:hypothetical protein